MTAAANVPVPPSEVRAELGGGIEVFPLWPLPGRA